MLRRLVLLLAFALLAFPSAEAATIPGVISGTGTLYSYYVVDATTVEGGAFDHTLVCAGCYVRFTLSSGSVTIIQNGTEQALAPNTYQIAGFDGVIGITYNGLHDYFVEIHGTGVVATYASQ